MVEAAFSDIDFVIDGSDDLPSATELLATSSVQDMHGLVEFDPGSRYHETGVQSVRKWVVDIQQIQSWWKYWGLVTYGDGLMHNAEPVSDERSVQWLSGWLCRMDPRSSFISAVAAKFAFVGIRINWHSELWISARRRCASIWKSLSFMPKISHWCWLILSWLSMSLSITQWQHSSAVNENRTGRNHFDPVALLVLYTSRTYAVVVDTLSFIRGQRIFAAESAF